MTSKNRLFHNWELYKVNIVRVYKQKLSGWDSDSENQSVLKFVEWTRKKIDDGVFSNKIITVKITVTKMFGLNLPIDVSFEGRPNVYLNELFLTSVYTKYAPQSESRDTKSIRRICSEIAWVHKASIKNNVALVQWSEWTRPAPSFVKDENRE